MKSPNDPVSLYRNPLYTAPLELGGMQLRPIDLLEHVLATGGTGSGKTRSFVLPLIEALLQRFGSEADEKAGMILLDAKGDMAELATECVRRAGRSADLWILGEGGNCWFDLFGQFDGDPTSIANFLFETLEDRCASGGGENDSFWEENARRLLRAAVICAKAAHGRSLGGISGISDGINRVMSVRSTSTTDDDDDEPSSGPVDEMETMAQAAFLEDRITLGESNDLLSYLRHDVGPGSPRTWSTIANMARNYLSQFSQPALRALFEEGGGRQKLCPEDVIDRGLLLVVSLSPVIFGEAATPFRSAIKKSFCERILQRQHLIFQEAGHAREINQIRPILYVMDEFHTVLNARGRSSDAYFLDRAREFRCMCLLATQGISAITAVVQNRGMRNHLLNNCRTKFFFANDCPETLEYFEFIGGMEDRRVANVRFDRVRRPPRFRLPNHTFVDQEAAVPVGYHIEHRKESRFRGSDLGALPNGTALVVGKGRTLSRFTRDPARYATGSTEAEGSR